MATKKLKTHRTSARKKSSLNSTGSRKAASKAAKKKAEELKRRRELGLLAHKMFGMVYEAYQEGKFHRIL
jgi:hypothetical protein